MERRVTEKKSKAAHELETTLHELSHGASMAFKNAQQLYQEACLLRSHGSLSRALFLYQISLEECGKIDILGGWATSLLMGDEINLAKLAAALVRHKAKNYTNAYMLPATKQEAEARADRDWTRALEAFKQQQAEFHNDSNTAKNAALYVDYENGQFSSPDKKITEEMVADIATLNSEFLHHVHLKVDMLSGWLCNVPEIQELNIWFKSRAEELMSTGSSNPDEVMSILMRELMDRAKR